MIFILLITCALSPRLASTRILSRLLKADDPVKRPPPSEIEDEVPKLHDIVRVCPICLQGDEPGESCPDALGPCGNKLHLFHGECIEKWLLKQKWCPVCKLRASDDVRLEVMFDIPGEALLVAI